MKILILYAHPSENSFTYKVLKSFTKGLLESNHEIEISDLYKMNFQSDMSEMEYNREGFVNTDLPIPNDVMLEQEKIEKADCICFIYPVWWSDCPAKLKGWFDRVFTVGYAYAHDGNGSKIPKMKTIKNGLVICTAGHPNDFLNEIGIAESMRNVMIDDRLGTRFENKEMIILGGTLNFTEVKAKHLNKVYEIGKNIENNFL